VVTLSTGITAHRARAIGGAGDAVSVRDQRAAVHQAEGAGDSGFAALEDYPYAEVRGWAEQPWNDL
jgi:hypothetical protein